MIRFERGRRFPLVQGEVWDAELRDLAQAADLKGCASPEGARAGLLLYAGAWDAAHNVAQDLHTPEGSYWHAILHRMEPDDWNSGYWFRKVGRHAVFAQVRDAAEGLGYAAGREWDAARFIEYCEEARRKPGSAMERIAIEVQYAEWEALFDWCSRPA
jgi:hypothetical protein